MLGKILIGSISFGKFTTKRVELLKSNGCVIINNPYSHALKEKELLQIISDIDGIITGMGQLSERVIASSKKLKIISKHGVGIDNININAAIKKGIDY